MVNEKSIKWIDKINLLIVVKVVFSCVIYVVVKKIKGGGGIEKKLLKKMNVSVIWIFEFWVCICVFVW